MKIAPKQLAQQVDFPSGYAQYHRLEDLVEIFRPQSNRELAVVPRSSQLDP
jgi:hypothetical protein